MIEHNQITELLANLTLKAYGELPITEFDKFKIYVELKKGETK